MNLDRYTPDERRWIVKVAILFTLTITLPDVLMPIRED